MRKLLLAGVMLGLIFVLTACGNDDALPSLPGSIVEAPVETTAPVDQNFNWSDLFDEDEEEDTDNSDFVFDGGYDDNDGEFTFDFGDDSAQSLLPPLEQEPAEMVLEQGIPLEGTNPDLAGIQQQNPVTAVPITEPIYEDDEDDEPLPLEVELPPEPVIEVDFDEPKGLPETNDRVTATIIVTLVGLLAVVVHLLTRNRAVSPNK